MENRVFECLDCGEKWEAEPCGTDGRHGYEIPCPKCGSLSKTKVLEGGEKHACGGPHGHGGCGCGCHKN